MLIKERIQKLRELMKERGIYSYVIPSADAHQSEYVADHWKCREWISGFTGSAGTVVITLDDAGLWADGRYYIQAEKQIEGSGIRLFKMGQPNVPTYIEWINEISKEESTVAFNGKVFSVASVKTMEKTFKRKKLNINSEYDLIGMLWNDRPNIPRNEIFVHEVKYAGKSRKEKLTEVREEMKKKSANYYLLTSLDDIAWLFNVRGRDVNNNPVATSYSVISLDKAYLFIDLVKVNDEVKNELAYDGVEVRDYDKVNETLGKLTPEDIIIFDENKTNVWLNDAIYSETEKIEEPNITTRLKAIKNEVEIENLKKCHIRDSVAMVNFLYWLEKSVGKETHTEVSAQDKLREFRAEQDLFIETSFDTIAGYKDHAAMMHYKAIPENTYSLKEEGLFLVDSGGQYFDGTTDITRTIVLGNITEEEKKDFTLVLKSMTALSRIKFLHGATGSNLDIIARQPIWEQGMDYKCGTGHGVGFLLNVHEGPQGFSQVPNTVKIEPGMILTNEPGIYKEGKHGIRIENTLLAVNDEQTEFGQFMKFETIAYCPIDLDAVDVTMLNEDERNWLNNYHEEVYKKLSPYLNEELKTWLRNETRSI